MTQYSEVLSLDGFRSATAFYANVGVTWKVWVLSDDELAEFVSAPIVENLSEDCCAVSDGNGYSSLAAARNAIYHCLHVMAERRRSA